MWERPWRWIIAGLSAVIFMGLLNEAAVTLGGPEYLGLPVAARAIALVSIAGFISLLVLPSPEKLEQAEPLPPLPSSFTQQSSSR